MQSSLWCCLSLEFLLFSSFAYFVPSYEKLNFIYLLVQQLQSDVPH